MENITTKITREIIQRKALEALLTHNGVGTLNIDTGVGKSKIVLDFIECKKDISRILITSPRSNLKKNWTKEFKRWWPTRVIEYVDHGLNITDPSTGEILEVWLENVQTTYKWSETEGIPHFDLVVGDEVHLFMTPEYSNVFNLKHKYLICLTATTDDKKKTIKQELYTKYAPIIYVYDTAEKDGIVNNVHVVVVNHTLDNNFKVLAGTKKKPFYTGELTNYEYLTAQIKRGQTLMAMQGSKDFFTDASEWFWKGNGNAQQKEAARVYLHSITKRRNMLLNLESTRTIAGRLAGILYDADLENKILVFSEMTNQVNQICKYTYHSNNSETQNTANLDAFNNGDIRILGSCYSLTLGLDMSGANTAIYESYQGSETLAKQRRGRLHRLDVDEHATLYVIRVLGTQMATWFSGFINEAEIEAEIDSTLILNKTWRPE